MLHNGSGQSVSKTQGKGLTGISLDASLPRDNNGWTVELPVTDQMKATKDSDPSKMKV